MAKNASGVESGHEPVLLAEIVAALAPLAGGRVVDGTFGAGGYSRALMKAGARVCAIDRDPQAAAFAGPLGVKYPERFQFVAGKFSELDSLCADAADGVVLDLGVSSMQLEDGGRGFSFRRQGPLDMRMGATGPTAGDLVNGASEKALAEIFARLGEERRARAVARAIVAAREKAPIATTTELAAIVAGAVGGRAGPIHPATRSFQALRIAVNDELGELVEGLFAAERLLTEGGRLAVVSFHSLEDRIVKRFFRPQVTASRHRPPRPTPAVAWKDVRRAVRPSAEEIAANPRARSATLRSGVRSAAPPRPADVAGLGVPVRAGWEARR